MTEAATMRNTFRNLPHDQKHQELVPIFSGIKQKNKNCGYIYEKLITKPELFDDILMEQIFAEVMEVYMRIQGENMHEQDMLLDKSRAYLEHLQQKEAQQHNDEAEEVEELLRF